MSIGSKIAQYRKEKGITQEALAQLLNVTNQAVSKWESDQCCPDIQILPKLADTFGVSIDALFERAATPIIQNDLPWEDDGDIRVVLYLGHQLLKSSRGAGDFVFRYEGPARNVISAVNVNCGDVEGDVDAGASVSCGNVGGDVDAGSGINCGNVGGDVDAGTSVSCADVGGDVDAGSNVTCAEVQGDIDAGGTVIIKSGEKPRL